jgi:hypothetical protein
MNWTVYVEDGPAMKNDWYVEGRPTVEKWIEQLM